MAYEHYYTIQYTNAEQQDVQLKIYKKDAATPPSIGLYEATQLVISKNCDELSKYGTIISSELIFGLWKPEVDDNDNPVTWETFITSSHDDWKVTVEVDGDFYFHGFLTPDEGNALFQDAPYEVVFKATDGLALLKDAELVKYDGSRFNTYGRSVLLDFIVGALGKTGLDLPIRIYCNVFHLAMLNRGDDLKWDFFSQAEVSNRSFLKDVNSFESCYDTLLKIFKNFCTIEYYNGMWQIVSIAEKQYLPGNWYYTDYAADGTGAVGHIVSENHAQVGKAVDIYPINENQTIASRFAYKQVKHVYNYVIPEDLVINQNLQRLGALIAPLSGSGYAAYEKIGWTHYQGQPQPLASQVASAANAYIKIEVDAFGTQTDRYYVVEKDSTAPSTVLQNYIRNDNPDFYGDKGDKIGISLSFRTKNDESSGPNLTMASLVLLKDGTTGNSAGDWYSIDESGIWGNTPHRTFAQYNITEDTSEWKTVNFDDLVLPASGSLWFLFGCGEVDNGNEAHFKDLKITYTPYIRGSLFSMKGDYWKTSQDINFPDVFEEDVYISDSPKRILKGGLWVNNQLADPTFYVYPDTATVTAFKEHLNLARFNHSYRRMYSIEGDFNGLNYAPENDPGVKKPIGFHKRYRFVDFAEVGLPTRDFVMVPSMTMDLMSATINTTFVEVIKDSADGTQTGDDHEFNYIF